MTEKKGHACVVFSPARSCGTAVKYCVEYEGIEEVFWAGNGEYETQVNFCPFCGTKAPVQIPSVSTSTDLALFESLDAPGHYSPWRQGEQEYQRLEDALLLC